MCATLQTIADGLVCREVKYEAFGMQMVLCCCGAKTLVLSVKSQEHVILSCWGAKSHVTGWASVLGQSIHEGPHSPHQAIVHSGNRNKTHTHTCHALACSRMPPCPRSSTQPCYHEANTPIRCATHRQWHLNVTHNTRIDSLHPHAHVPHTGRITHSWGDSCTTVVWDSSHPKPWNPHDPRLYVWHRRRTRARPAVWYALKCPEQPC